MKRAANPVKLNTDHPSVIFGLPETGLAIGRSLAKNGIKVYGICHQKEIGCYSRYIEPVFMPHPLVENDSFLQRLTEFRMTLCHKPVPFFASDEYLSMYSRNEAIITNYFISNIPTGNLIRDISDKYSLYQMAIKAGTDVPKTFFVSHYILYICFSCGL